MLAPHSKDAKEVMKELNTNIQTGLSKDEAEHRLNQYGLNEIKKERTIFPFKIFLAQFTSPLVLILIAATIISALLKEYIDAGVILVIIIINAILGFFQEYRAERAIEALQKLAAPKAKVIRNGHITEIESRYLVPGDIILVETGDKIPADARIVETMNLRTQEAALTGESTSVQKDIAPLKENTQVADQKNMLFAGTIITAGHAKAAVTSTGMQTQFGKIAKLVQESRETKTPLQLKLAGFAKFLGLAAIIIVAITFVLGLFRGEPILKMFITSVSLAVAAVPEGLPIVVTISLAIGVQRMAKRNALIRKLPSVETLGSVSVICTDKTGTLTHNEMTVKKIFVSNSIIDVSGSGYSKNGALTENGKVVNPQKFPELNLLLKIGMLCNNAKIEDNNNNQRKVIGDPTEGCLIVSAEKANLTQDELNKQYPRINEIEFTSERKRMTTIHLANKKHVAFSKGAPDILLEKCDRILINGRIERLTPQYKKQIIKTTEEFANQALRILGFAYKENVTAAKQEQIEKDMIFVGLQAMIDPPREEVKEAIAKCKTAGIKVVMITGDHIATAAAIAKEIGIEGEALTGEDLDKLTAEQLKKRIEHIGIFARVNPEHKMKIIDAFKSRSHFVAMTGDGINDAPAIKKADIGIAMGITGTDVSKEASDMILTDDNFTSIVNAVEEGRNIFDNILKFIVYLLSSNIGELLTVFAAILIGLPLPLFAVQILWINLVTDGLPATALSVEPAEPEIMQRKPRPKSAKIITNKRLIWMILIGVIMMLSTLGIYLYALLSGGWQFGQHLAENDYLYNYATTLAFTTLMMLQMFNVLSCKSLDTSLFKHKHLITNKWLWLAIASSIALQAAVLYIPGLNALFDTVPLSIFDWLYITIISSSVLWFSEIIKIIQNKLHKSLD